MDAICKSSLCCRIHTETLLYIIAPSITVIVALAAISALATGLLAHFGVIKNIHPTVIDIMISGGSITLGESGLQMLAIIGISAFFFYKWFKDRSSSLAITSEMLYDSFENPNTHIKDLNIDLGVTSRLPYIGKFEVQQIKAQFPNVQKLSINFQIEEVGPSSAIPLFGALDREFTKDNLASSEFHHVFTRKKS